MLLRSLLILVFFSIISCQNNQKPTNEMLASVSDLNNQDTIGAFEYIYLKDKIEEKKVQKKPSINNNNEVIDTTGPNTVLLDSITYKQYQNDWKPFDNIDTYYEQYFIDKREFISDGYDFPVGKPDARGYYIARRFMQNRHLGDDFNAVSGGDTDLGDPIFAIANGFVCFSHDLKGGWGKTVRIIHRNLDGSFVESLYSHCNEIFVEYGQYVKRGEKIATIGTAHGQYPAHLHLELRTQLNLPLGRGYSDNPVGYTAPTPYIRANRPRW